MSMRRHGAITREGRIFSGWLVREIDGDDFVNSSPARIPEPAGSTADYFAATRTFAEAINFLASAAGMALPNR